MIDVTKLYRKLLRLYPASFRQEYEAAMDRQFRDEQRDAHGWKENISLWLHALSDIAASAPRELVRRAWSGSALCAEGLLPTARECSHCYQHAGPSSRRKYRGVQRDQCPASSKAAVRRCITVGRAMLFAGYRGKRPRRLCRVAQSQFVPGERGDIFHIRDEPELGPRCPASSSHRDFC